MPNGEFVMQDQNVRGVVLEVPYREKDQAKALGARWDPELKKWFVPHGMSTTLFRKWLAGGTTATEGSETSKRNRQ